MTRSKVAGDRQAVVGLVIGNRQTRHRTGNSINRPVVVTIGCKLLLGVSHHRTAALINRHGPEAAVNDQPSAVIPAVLMMVPVMLLTPVPIRMVVSGSPAASITIGTGVLSTAICSNHDLGLIGGVTCASTTGAARLRDLRSGWLSCHRLIGTVSAGVAYAALLSDLYVRG